MRFADADILGHVNNINLQQYFDLGKFDFYRSVLGESGIEANSESLVLASTTTNYYFQTRLTDEIYVTTEVEKVGTKSITFLQKIVDKASGRVNADCRTVAVGYDFVVQETIELLPRWREAIENFIQK